jgi:hypothetical protein
VLAVERREFRHVQNDFSCGVDDSPCEGQVRLDAFGGWLRRRRGRGEVPWQSLDARGFEVGGQVGGLSDNDCTRRSARSGK